MAIILNTTPSDIELEEYGIIVDAGQTHDLENGFETTAELSAHINNGNIVFVVSGDNLTQAKSIDLYDYISNADVYTNEQIDQKFSDLVNGAGSALDTLNEISNALGDDPNFAATITNELANKAPLVHTHPLPTHNHDELYYTEAEVLSLLSAKSDNTHVHDTRYYLKSEIDNLLVDKSDISHIHDTRYYTQAQVDALIAAVPVPIFGTEHHFVNNYQVTTSTNSQYVTKSVLNANLTAGHTYRYSWSYNYNSDSTSHDFESRVMYVEPGQVGVVHMEHKQEPKDVAGNYVATGSDQKYQSSGFNFIEPNTSGLHNLELQFRTSTSGIKASIWEVRLELFRVS